MNYLWRDIDYHVILRQGWGGGIGHCEINIVAKRINPPDQQQIIIKHAYEKMLFKTFSFGPQIRTFTNRNDFLQNKTYSGSFWCHSGSFRSIPVSFRFIPVHSGVIPVSFRFIPVHSGVIPVHSGPFRCHSGPFRCHSGSFRSIPPHSGSFRSVSVFSNAPKLNMIWKIMQIEEVVICQSRRLEADNTLRDLHIFFIRNNRRMECPLMTSGSSTYDDKIIL